jgi:hypothetical protein
MRCDRLWRAGSPRVRRSKSSPARLAGVSPPAPAAVSFVVSFAEIRERPLRPSGHGHPRSRTGTACRERWGAHLESVLSASPRGFESRILRRANLQEHSMMAVGMQASWVAWSHLVVSVLSAGRCRGRDKPSVLCLVTGAPYRPVSRLVQALRDLRVTWLHAWPVHELQRSIALLHDDHDPPVLGPGHRNEKVGVSRCGEQTQVDVTAGVVPGVDRAFAKNARGPSPSGGSGGGDVGGLPGDVAADAGPGVALSPGRCFVGALHPGAQHHALQG